MGSGTDLDSDQTDIESIKNGEISLRVSSLKRHKCPHEGCNSAFNRPWKLDRHVNTHTKQRPFKCDRPGCNKDYTNNSHLQRHKAVSHAEVKPVPVYIDCPFPECKKVFTNKWSLKKHCNTHKNKDVYKCSVCSIIFKKCNQLKSHLYIHLGVNPFECQTCKESFTTKKNLKRHEKKHKTYCCESENCNAQFDTWNLLRRHLKVSHPKTFQCDSCGKVFITRWAITEHVLSHIPEEQREVLVCPHDNCGRYYFHQRNLNQHIRSIHLDINHKCDFNNCGQVFTTKGKLQKHKKIHTELNLPKTKPSKPKKPRRPRKDKGLPRKSMAAALSGIILPSKIDKKLAQSNITSDVLECIKNIKETLCNEVDSESDGKN